MVLPVRKYISNGTGLNTTDYSSSKDGQVITLRAPAYACDSNAEVVTMVLPYLREIQSKAMEWILNHYQDTKITHMTYIQAMANGITHEQYMEAKDNQITYKAYMEAIRFRDKYGSDLIDLSLDLHCGAVISQGGGSVSKDTLPFLANDPDFVPMTTQKVYDADPSGLENPIPLSVHHQFEVVLLALLKAQQHSLLKKLHDALSQAKPRPWNEMYSTFFIVFTCLEWTCAGALRYKASCKDTVITPEDF